MTSVYGKTKVSYEWENREKWLLLSFPIDEYQERVARLRQAMEQNALDYLLIYSSPACSGPVRYLANFESFFGNTIVILPQTGEPALVTDCVMHSEPMHTGIWMSWIREVHAGHHPATVREADNICDFVVDVLKDRALPAAKGGLVSARWLPHGLMNRLYQLLPDIQLQPADAIFDGVRAIKSSREIAHLRKSAEIASIGLNVAFEKATVGIAEKEVASYISDAMMRAGADYTRVTLTSGPRSGFKHAPPTDRKIENGDMMFVDLLAPYDGYMSDVARTGVVGTAAPQPAKMLEAALDMRNAVVAAVKPGARICDLQSIAENIAKQQGFAEYYYPTGFGHGIGTSVVESPVLFPDNEACLEQNMVFSLEPMIVIEGVGTAVFEDMILVTSSGAESLSNATMSTW